MITGAFPWHCGGYGRQRILLPLGLPGFAFQGPVADTIFSSLASRGLGGQCGLCHKRLVATLVQQA
eukprot:12893001-Prorocentrum_lima.AAC.1